MNILKKLTFVSMGLLLMWSCKKEGETITVSTGDVPALAASATVLELNRDDEAQNAVTFDWADYQTTWSNTAAATDIVNYTLQISEAGNNFQNILVSKDAEGTSVSFTTVELNTALIGAQVTPGEAADFEARLRVTIAANRHEYTNIINLQITPYEDVVGLPTLYLAGTFNDWSHSEDYRVVSRNNDDNYEGYVNLPDADAFFKFSSEASWDGTNYGDGGSGSLSTDGENIPVAEAGYYLFRANITNLTWSATKVTWGLIGDAVGGWGDADDVVMTYNAETRLWTATVTMSAGPWKFRANGGWDLNLGASDQPGVLSYGGGDFNQTAAATYIITLDLTNPAEYTYTIEAQ